MQVVLRESRCNEIIDNMTLSENRYLQQKVSYELKMVLLEEKISKDPKKKHKIPKEPVAPLHSYTAVSYAKECLVKINSLKSIYPVGTLYVPNYNPTPLSIGEWDKLKDNVYIRVK